MRQSKGTSNLSKHVMLMKDKRENDSTLNYINLK